MRKYNLIEKDHGESTILKSGTIDEIIRYLKDNPNLYEWMLDENPDKKMPDMDSVDNIFDLRYELDNVDLSWWALEIEPMGTLERLWGDESVALEGIVDKPYYSYQQSIDRDQAFDDSGKACYDGYYLIDSDFNRYYFSVEEIEAFAKTW